MSATNRHLCHNRTNTIIFCLSFVALQICSCNNFKTVKAGRIAASNSMAIPFSEKLQTIYQIIDTVNYHKRINDITYNLHLAYWLNEGMPIWFSKNKPSIFADSLLTDLESIKNDGIDPEKYGLSHILQLKEKLLHDSANINLCIAFDTACSRAYLNAAKDLLMGTIRPAKADSLWHHPNDSLWNGVDLLLTNDEQYNSLTNFRSTIPTYHLLRNTLSCYYNLLTDSIFLQNQHAIKGRKLISENDSETNQALLNIISKELPWYHIDPTNDSMDAREQFISTYQYCMGQRVNGIADSICINRAAMPVTQLINKLKANLERIRWMQQKEDSLYIIVDVPLMELFFRKDHFDMMHMRVVVGKPERQTPSLMANMTNIVINPSWGVPPTILKKDVLPGITKSGKKYLAKKGLKAYDREGKHIDEGTITAKNYKRYIYKQSPGDDNSLGYVKFNLPNPYDIYLHDTPHRGDFGNRYGALSSGCVRLQEPQEMAVFILSKFENKRYTFATLDSMIETHKTRWEILKTKIPVHIVYLTTFEDSTAKYPRFLNDVYKRDSCLISLLK